MEGRFDSGRIEALSDGVFAISITLLVLEITLPADAFQHLGHAIAHEWPAYMAYVTSFLTIGTAWFVHHEIFRRMTHADPNIMRLNLLVLMVVAFLPFPTGLLGEAIHSREAERTAVFFYGGVLAAMLLLLAGLARYVASRDQLLVDRAEPADLKALAIRLTPGLGSYAVVLALAAVAPRVTAFGFLAIAAGQVVNLQR
jgi:uncharacterized membrane protein